MSIQVTEDTYREGAQLMGIFSEIPPGQSSNDWGPLTLQCTDKSYLVWQFGHDERVNSVVPIIRLPVPCVASVANDTNPSTRMRMTCTTQRRSVATDGPSVKPVHHSVSSPLLLCGDQLFTMWTKTTYLESLCTR